MNADDRADGRRTAPSPSERSEKPPTLLSAAKAAQVWPDGKVLGSCSATRGTSPSTVSQGRVRPTRCLSATLVHKRPSSMASRLASPAFRVFRKQSMSRETAIHSMPASPSLVYT